MPITSSAKKAIRNAAKKRVFNLERKDAIREAGKELKALVADKNGKEARAALAKAYQALDKATKRGVLKPNTAARKKSRLAALAKSVA